MSGFFGILFTCVVTQVDIALLVQMIAQQKIPIRPTKFQKIICKKKKKKLRKKSYIACFGGPIYMLWSNEENNLYVLLLTFCISLTN